MHIHKKTLILNNRGEKLGKYIYKAEVLKIEPLCIDENWTKEKPIDEYTYNYLVTLKIDNIIVHAFTPTTYGWHTSLEGKSVYVYFYLNNFKGEIIKYDKHDKIIQLDQNRFMYSIIGKIMEISKDTETIYVDCGIIIETDYNSENEEFKEGDFILIPEGRLDVFRK